MKWFQPVVALGLVSVFGCDNDVVVRRSCPETVYETTNETTTTTATETVNASAFDIENVSVLEATDVLPGGADAIILDADRSQVPQGATWRVGAVDVLVMIPAREFDASPDAVPLTVQVWDANTPRSTSAPAWSVRQTLDKHALTWDLVTLPGATWLRAWWTFTFASDTVNIIPESGMHSAQYLVGVKWDDASRPAIGYSNFNRACNRNWTDPDGSGWVLNSTLPGTVNECSWPMLRVKTEVRQQVTRTVTVPVTRPVTIMVERDVCDPNAVEQITPADGGVDAGTP